MHPSLSFDDYLSITHVKAEYFEAVDSRDWPRLRSLFTDDAHFEGFAFQAGTGPEGFIAALQEFMEGARSNHLGFMPRLRAVGIDIVRGVWSLHDYVTWEPDTRPYKGILVPGQWGIRGYGLYEDEYRRTSQGWKIALSRLLRTRIDPLVGEPALDPGYAWPTKSGPWLEGRSVV